MSENISSYNCTRQRINQFISVCLLVMILSIPILSLGNIIKKTDSLPRVSLLSYVDKIGAIKPVHTAEEWQIKRRQILDSMQAVMGALPERKHLPPLNIQTLDSLVTQKYTRYAILFTVAENENIPAYLYVPVQQTAIQKRPAILALHETGMGGKKITDGQTGKPNMAYAKELAERGYVVIAPDYPGFGDMAVYDFKSDAYQSGTMKSIFDNMRCVDLLQSRPDVDPNRIGVIGHSLGGHTALFTAAFDTRLKCVVSSCGWTLMQNYFNGDTAAAQKNGGKLWPWAQERYMPPMSDKYNLDPDKIPFDFDAVIAAIAPRAFFSSSPLRDANFNVAGVKKGIANAAGVYDFLQVPGNLQVRYPDSEHDFPTEVRWQAYQFIDSVLGMAPGENPGWVLEQAHAGWFPRDSQGELVYRNQLWILGGWFNSYEAPPRDVWNSANGKDWKKITDSAPWIHSDLAMSVVFKKKMWMMGGWYKGRLDGHSASNEVWSSKEGIKWVSETKSAAWSPRVAAAVVEFKDKLWLMGGTENYYFGDSNSLKNDVWCTANGKDWTLVTADAGWPPRAYHQAAVLNGKIYLFGGGNYTPTYFALNDVWSSEDGEHWTKVCDAAPWHERIWFSSVVYRNRIWVMAGWSGSPHKNWSDVWSSDNGKKWTQHVSLPPGAERHEPSAFVFKDKIWIAGGMTPPLVNDVWSLQLPVNWKPDADSSIKK